MGERGSRESSGGRPAGRPSGAGSIAVLDAAWRLRKLEGKPMEVWARDLELPIVELARELAAARDETAKVAVLEAVLRERGRIR